MKRTLALIIALVMVVSLTACGGSGKSETTNATTSGGQDGSIGTGENANDQNDESILSADQKNSSVVADEVIMAIKSQPSLTPWGTNIGTEALWQVYEGLYGGDSNGEMYPVLADASKGEFGGYDHEEGSGDYTVYIYDYIYDHEGNHITANDVKFCFEHQFNDEFTSGWGTFQSVEVIDDTTCVFHFERELNLVGELKNIWARCFIISETAWNDSPSDLTLDMCGTGAYKLEAFTSGSKIVLEKNEDYWQTDEELINQYQKANVNKITYLFIDEAAQQVIALKTGEVDIVASVAANSLEDFREGGQAAGDFNIYNWLQKGNLNLLPNCSPDSICGDVNFRKAVLYAIDVDGIATAMGTDTVSPSYSLMSSAFSEYNLEWDNWENYQTVADVELSKEYLAQSGYSGETIRLLCEPQYTQVAEIMQNMLLNVGIEMSITTYDKNAYDALKVQSAEWDFILERIAGDSGVAQLSNMWNTSNSATGETTQNFISDAKWQDMLENIRTKAGLTTENIDEWMEHGFDNAYGMALYMEINNIVYRNNIQSMIRTDKNVLLPGGFTYIAE